MLLLQLNDYTIFSLNSKQYLGRKNQTEKSGSKNIVVTLSISKI